jgi:iron complex transport system substrate-binding protein
MHAPRAVAFLAAGVLAAIACGQRAAATPDGAARLVTVGTSTTEIVHALGLGDRIVGVDTSSTYPAAAVAAAKVGYQRALAAEGLLSLRPSHVLAGDEAGPPTVLTQLRGAGVPVTIVPSALSIDGVGARIRIIASALEVAPAGDALATRVETEARAASAAAQRPVPPRALLLYARGAGMAMVAGAGTSGDAMLTLAGATNVAGSIEGYRPISAEIVLASAPDVIVAPTGSLASLGGIDGLLALPGFAGTPAGKARRVVTVDDALLLGFGPRLPEAIATLATGLRAPAP